MTTFLKEAPLMNVFPNFVKQNLFSIINDMANNLDPFVKNPGIDFSRNRKLPFVSVVTFLIAIGGNCIKKELFESLGFNSNSATTPAFIQQRDKILPYAFEFLLHKFNQSFHDLNDYRGYRLLAVDGSALRIAYNPHDHDTFVQNKQNEKGYNILHLNAMYDLCNKIYLDALIQPYRKMNECLALCEMVDRSTISGNVIVVADRGFECYNNFAHLEEKGWNYLIRVKDIHSNGIIASLPLPAEEEFDISVNRILTKKHDNNEIDAHPDIYKVLPYRAKFDFLDKYDSKFYPISFRVVRFKITDNSYETIITNLNQSDFPLDELKKIYSERWLVETSFRELKYDIGLTSFHAKKKEYIIQEIFARIIMYNFALMITMHVIISQADTRYVYQVNFSVAIHICKCFLRLWNNVPPPDIEAMLRKNILPVRPGRKYERKIRTQKAVSFIYRVA
jgi:hypothetical protein